MVVDSLKNLKFSIQRKTIKYICRQRAVQFTEFIMKRAEVTAEVIKFRSDNVLGDISIEDVYQIYEIMKYRKRSRRVSYTEYLGLWISLQFIQNDIDFKINDIYSNVDYRLVIEILKEYCINNNKYIIINVAQYEQHRDTLTKEEIYKLLRCAKHFKYAYRTIWSYNFREVIKRADILPFVYIYCCKLSSKAKGTRMAKKANQDQIFDYQFKILIIGNSSVGKTSFLFRYVDDSFTSAFVSTVGIDFKVKTVFRKEKRIKLHIWVSEIRILYFSCRLIHFLLITTWVLMNYEYFYYYFKNLRVLFLGNRLWEHHRLIEGATSPSHILKNDVINDDGGRYLIQ